MLLPNENVDFRCPIPLKAKMKAFAEANQQRLSAFIRSACVEAMKNSQAPLSPVQKLEELNHK
jgi:hypothetical protein